MAYQIICDKCGKIAAVTLTGQTKPNGWADLKTTGSASAVSATICGPCSDYLRRWLNDRPGEVAR